jgi:hypothetical protein
MSCAFLKGTFSIFVLFSFVVTYLLRIFVPWYKCLYTYNGKLNDRGGEHKSFLSLCVIQVVYQSIKLCCDIFHRDF